MYATDTLMTLQQVIKYNLWTDKSYCEEWIVLLSPDEETEVIINKNDVEEFLATDFRQEEPAFGYYTSIIKTCIQQHRIIRMSSLQHTAL
jgi:hypothetical protein